MPKLLESYGCFLQCHQCRYSTSVPDLDYKKAKNKKGLHGIYSVFKQNYDIGYPELMSFVTNHFPKVKSVGKTNLNEIMVCLKEKNYKWEDIKKDKEILMLSYSDIKKRLRLLDDLYICHPRLHDVLHITVYMESKISLLRDIGVYEENFDVASHLLWKAAEFELPDDIVHKIKEYFTNAEEYSLADIYIYILIHYLSQRFMVDIETVKDLVRLHRVPEWKPFSAYPEICDMVIDVLHIDFSTVMDHPWLLDIDPRSFLQLMRKHPVIGGTSVMDIIKRYPKFLDIPHVKLTKWMHIFKKYQVSKFTVTPRAIKLFNSTKYEEAEKRLEVLHKLPEFEIIMTSKEFFGILQTPHAIKKVIDLKHSGHGISSLNSLFHSSKSPEEVWLQRIPKEMRLYIAQALGIDEKDSEFALLRDVRTNLGLANTQMVLRLLLDYGFTKEQVLNGIQILGFDHIALKSTLKDFSSLPETQPFDEWMKNPNVIHLLAYVVKKNNPAHW